MHRLLNLLLILFFSCYHASAQLQPISGARLVTSSGVLQGYVRNRPKQATPQFFDYSESKDGPWTRLDIASLQRVELDDSTVFERHPIHVAIFAKPVSDRQRDDYTPAVYFRGDALLEQLLEGSPSLFSLTDSFNVEHFFYRMEGDTGLQAIRYEPYDDPYERGQFSYRNDLERLGITAGCGEGVRSDVTHVDYETADIIRFFQQLNTCNGHTAQVIGRLNKKRTVIRAGIGAGGRLARHYFTLPYNSEAKTHTLGAVLGAWIDYLPRRQNSNQSIGMGLSFLFGNGDFQPGDKVLRFPYVSVSYKAVYFDVTARRLFGVARRRPFLEGGLMVGGFLSGRLEYGVLNPSGGMEQVESSFGGSSTEALLGAGFQGTFGSLHLRYGQPLVGNNPFRDRNLSLVFRVALKN